MNKFNKLINEYLSPRDTDLKRLLHQKKIESSFTAGLFIDNVFYRCGILSANVILNLDSKNKYKAYINFSEDNIFHESGGIKELINTPVSENDAQKILAKNVIGLLEKVNYEKVNKRIS